MTFVYNHNGYDDDGQIVVVVNWKNFILLEEAHLMFFICLDTLNIITHLLVSNLSNNL